MKAHQTISFLVAALISCTSAFPLSPKEFFTAAAASSAHQNENDENVGIAALASVMGEWMLNRPWSMRNERTNETTCITDIDTKTNINTNYEVQIIKPQGWVSTFAQIFMNLLGAHALLTTSITTAIIGGIGDIFAQCLAHEKDAAAFRFDWNRFYGIVFVSIFFSGPLMHFTYDFLEEIVPIHERDDIEEILLSSASESVSNSKSTQSQIKIWTATAFHVLVDIFILGGICVISMMATTSIFEGRLNMLKRDLDLDFAPTYKASIWSSLAFMPLQMVAFRMLPVELRWLYMSVDDVVWNTVVSYASSAMVTCSHSTTERRSSID